MSAINSDPEVMRWIGAGSVRDEQQTKAAIETFERRWDQHGFGMFVDPACDRPVRSTRSPRRSTWRQAHGSNGDGTPGVT